MDERKYNVNRIQRYSRGTTLIEVLVSLLVLMAGLLAVAGLQSVALLNNHGAFLRSQAVIQAHDMADRMYANTAAVQAGAYNAISGIPSSPPTCMTSVAPGHASLETLSCTPAEMATFDAWQWNTANANVLPGGQGTVSGPDGNGAYTITISWIEQEADATRGDNQGYETKTFSFAVEPLP
jgi:type IV pilus assembly protein PilV